MTAGGPVHEKEVSPQKAEEIRQVRPVEKSESGDRTEKKKAKKENSSKYVVDNNKVFFEKYDKNGDLILRIPPSDKPVDEKA